MVKLRGMSQPGGTPGSGVMYTLPVGSRPSGIRIFSVFSDSVAKTVSVYPDGRVMIVADGGGTVASWIETDDIAFIAEQ